MVSTVGSALSGLAAASKRVEVSANNLANQSSTSSVVDGILTDRPYVPQTVDQVSLSTGGTQAIVRDVSPASTARFEPTNADADTSGVVNVPNVDTATELVKMKIASYDYKANLKVLKINDDMQKNLLDIFG